MVSGLWAKESLSLFTIVQSTTNMDHNNMVSQMELRLSFSQ